MKWAKRIIAGVVVLIIIVLVVVFISLDSIIRAEVQTQATASLNVPTTLTAADLSILGGKVSLTDLEIGSPPNFSAPHTFTLGGTSVQVSYSQLTGNPIHISKITIDNPVLYIEQANLKLNLQALMDQIPQTPKTSSGQPSTPMKLIIDELDVNNAQVNFQPGLPGLSAAFQVPIPSLTLKNIGNADGSQNGAAIKDVVMQVVTSLAAKAGDAAQIPPELKALLSSSLGNISQQLGGAFKEQFQNVAGGLGNVLKGAGSGASGGANSIGQGLQGLFGGNKSKTGQ